MQVVQVVASLQFLQDVRQSSHVTVTLLKNLPSAQESNVHKVVFGSWKYPSKQVSHLVAFIHVAHPLVQLSQVLVTLL